MMSPRQKALIKAEFFLLWQKDFGDVEKKIEYAHQAIDLKNTVYGLPNNEIRNAIGDSHDALTERHSFKRAKLKLAYARRHLYRARRMYLAAAVYGIERKIRTWLKNMKSFDDAEIRDLRRRLNQLKADRLRMPKLRKSSEGGNIEQVQKKTLRLHNECMIWGGLFRNALRIYDQLTD